jgi:two-component system cell cycle response regulator
MSALVTSPLLAFRSAPIYARVAMAVTVGLGTAQLASTLLASNQPRIAAWLLDGAIFAAAALCMLRGFARREDRAAWWLLGAGLLCWAVGDRYYSFYLIEEASPPVPSPADVGYLLFYPLAAMSLLLQLRRRLGHLSAELLLDAVIGVLAVASVAVAFVFPHVLTVSGGDIAKVVVGLAYPIGDLALLGVLVAGMQLIGWRPDGAWLLIAAGLLLFVAADSVYLYQTSAGTWVSSTPLDSLWGFGCIAMGLAAWAPQRNRVHQPGTWSTLLPAGVFIIAAFAIESAGDLGFRAGPAARWLAAGTLLAAMVRLLWALARNRQLVRAREVAAVRDELTGLRNRRALMEDLDEAARRRDQRVLCLFDLNHFKHYNDTFGHAAGDSLLLRLGGALTSAVTGHGAAYRLGGDEFCVIAETRATNAEALLERGRQALSERGQGFAVTAEGGAVVIPDEAVDRTTALRLADERMYAEKRRRPEAAEEQATETLARALAAREPQLTRHVGGTVAVAVDVARRVGLTDADHLGLIRRAVLLRDLGKVAIPDSILHKPEPLTPDEAHLLRHHTAIGYRILHAAPALRPVADIVRRVSERWDGRGYPGELAGEDIPLEARIVSVCGAFESLTVGRPYRPVRSDQAAIDEIRRASGTQFDPKVVEALVRSVTERSAGAGHLELLTA